jgi:hypothetical protein
MPNQSELDFIRRCETRKLPCEPISTGERKTPDFRLSLPNVDALVEIKQLDPNPEERAADADLEANGYHTKPVTFDLERVRRKIRDANSQLRSVATESEPGLVVLSTDMMWAPIYFSDANMASTMFGGLVYVTSTQETRLGGKRTLREGANTSISAVCVMKSEEFVAFHNPFAGISLMLDDLLPLVDRQCWYDFPPPEGTGPAWTAVPRAAV